MKLKQPIGLCDNCRKLAGDPVMNCPVAQAIRESGVLARVVECDKQISIKKSGQCERAALVQ